MPSSKGTATRGRPAKTRIVKKELTQEEILNLSTTYNFQNVVPTVKPSVEITKCISFQKFRYHGENRPGKKYQEKEFMSLKLSNLTDKVVRIVIICTDADNRELIHPNGLVGKDCHDGIYDKEYAVTKQFFIIKIPYLRTERIKTKKNEHAKIQQVLSDRASHLPSPYKERCLSQCTDKYTSSRKFDTTKVCLGVIVTVQSHQGTFNGSLHAISHVVRNASEKTSLAIFKLSSDTVPAATGAYIDIFTTEDGPAIEPEKYLVHVSQDCEVNGVGPWESEKHSPTKEDILYKRVITYQVPPYLPNQELASEVKASLHLECPQSNQYCTFQFTYVPQEGIVVVDEHGHTYGATKRSYPDQQDIKPCTKKLRQDIEEGSRESLMSNLKTKIISRKEIPNVAARYLDSSGDRQEEVSQHYIIDHQTSQGEPFQQEHSVFIRHQDPHTGEASYLLDMDATRANRVGDENQQYALQQFSLNSIKEKSTASHFLQSVKGMRGKVSPFQAHSQDVEVVATGYSDAVPPNTTVLIYTTNGGSSDATGQQVVIERMSEDNPVIIANSSGPRNEESEKDVEAASSSRQAAKQNGLSSEQIVRRELINEQKLPVRQVTSQADETYQRGPAYSVSEPAVHVSEQPPNAGSSHSASDIHTTRSARKYESERLSPVPTSSAASIPPLRRMLIPNKNISSASPWEVGTEDDSSDLSILQGIFPGTNRKNSPYDTAVKKEPTDSVKSNHTNSSSKAISGYQKYGYIPDKQLHKVEENGNQPSNNNSGEDHASELADCEHAATAKDRGNSMQKAGLSSLDLANAVADNLPTINVFEIAKNLECDGLPSIAEDEHMETTQQKPEQQQT